MCLVTVVIPVFNRVKVLKECLFSIKEQFNFPFEVIVIDDGSTSGSSIKNIVNTSGKNAKYVRVNNGGAPKARNLGLQLAKGKYIKFLDSDDVIYPGTLQTQAELLDNTFDSVVCYSDWEFIGDLNDPRVGGRPIRIMGNISDPIDALLTDWWCAQFAYMYNREAIKTIKWNTTLHAAQDFDFILKVAATGAKFIYLEQLSGGYRIGNVDQISSTYDYAKCLSRLNVLRNVTQNLIANQRMNPKRLTGICEDLYGLTRFFYEKDKNIYFESVDLIHKLHPHFFPHKVPYIQKTAVKILGISKAEALLCLRKKLKNLLD